MSTFQVPFSSSPAQPSTPDTSAKHSKTSRSFLAGLPPHPSTTPLGPPPSSIGSFTPADPPPPSLLGSSQIDDDSFSLRSSNGMLPISYSGKSRQYDASNAFSPRGNRQLQAVDLSGSPLSSKSVQFSDLPRLPLKGRREFGASDVEDSEYEESTFPGQASLSPYQLIHGRKKHDALARSMNSLSADRPSKKSFDDFSSSQMRGSKRSRTGDILRVSPQQSWQQWSASGDSNLSTIAQNLTHSMKPAVLDEPREFITRLETCLQKSRPTNASQPDIQAYIHKTSESVCAALDRCVKGPPMATDQTQSLEIGPSEDAPLYENAAWLSILLLQTHRPTSADILESEGQDIVESKHDSVLLNDVSPSQRLLDWLDRCHNPWAPVVAEVNLQEPSPPAHCNFWDIILSLILRGKLESVIAILKKSSFGEADSALKDGYHNGYNEHQSYSIEEQVEKLVSLLQRCPGGCGDWHVDGNDWILFRKAARKSLTGLEATTENPRHSDSAVPWTVYQSLKILYGILIGHESEILASAQDWVEATIGLAIWRKADESPWEARSILSSGPLALGQSMPHSHESAPSSDRHHFLRRLSWSFQRATDDSKGDSFQVNTGRPIEISLACVFEGHYAQALGLINRWSLPVTDAVIELASAGGWYLPYPPISKDIMENFDSEDLMLLGTYGTAAPEALSRDGVIIEYASALFERGQQSEDVESSKLDWRLATSIMMRVGDRAAYSHQINDILSSINIDSDATMDSVLDICNQCKVEQRGHALAERHADLILDNTDDFGRALKYYARGQAARKIRNVLDLLISMSLIRSNAFPSQQSLDEDLNAFLDHESLAYEEFLEVDRDATLMLRESMSGYATIRQFYNLRDNPRKAEASLDECKRALLAAIASASDNIDGGLLDEHRSALIRFEGLLVLLGEALAFFKDTPGSLDDSQLRAVMSAIENLQTLPKQTYQQCEDFLQSTLAFYHGQTKTPSPSKLLQTMSSMTSGSSFSLVSSSLLESMSGDSVEDGAVEEKRDDETKRVWDWRAGMKKDATGESILRILRLNVAQRLATSWIQDGIQRK